MRKLLQNCVKYGISIFKFILKAIKYLCTFIAINICCQVVKLLKLFLEECFFNLSYDHCSKKKFLKCKMFFLQIQNRLVATGNRSGNPQRHGVFWLGTNFSPRHQELNSRKPLRIERCSKRQKCPSGCVARHVDGVKVFVDLENNFSLSGVVLRGLWYFDSVSLTVWPKIRRPRFRRSLVAPTRAIDTSCSTSSRALFVSNHLQ